MRDVITAIFLEMQSGRLILSPPDIVYDARHILYFSAEFQDTLIYNLQANCGRLWDRIGEWIEGRFQGEVRALYAQSVAAFSPPPPPPPAAAMPRQQSGQKRALDTSSDHLIRNANKRANAIAKEAAKEAKKRQAAAAAAAVAAPAAAQPSGQGRAPAAQRSRGSSSQPARAAAGICPIIVLPDHMLPPWYERVGFTSPAQASSSSLSAASAPVPSQSGQMQNAEATSPDLSRLGSKRAKRVADTVRVAGKQRQATAATPQSSGQSYPVAAAAA